MRNNQEYWESRAIDRINRFTADSEKVADELGKAYLLAAQQLKADIAKVFKGFENAFGLSEKEAKALIDESSGELPSKDIIKAIESIADKDKQREMKAIVSAPAYQFRMKRLDRTAENAKKICESLRTLETRTDTAFLRAEMDKAYKNIIFDIQQGTDISGAFSQIPKSRIEQVLKENWSGKHYSTRIWNNTEKLADDVKQSLVESFMTGAGEREAAAAIQEKFAVGANEARRLIRTENTYVTGQAELEGYKTAQVEEYEYAALIDGRTSEICKALDGKFFKITEAKAGENYPPMHPYCRSSTMAKLPSEEELEQEFDTFAADNIPEGMDFEEWLDGLEPTEDGKLVFRDKRVDKSGKSGIMKSGAYSGAKKTEGWQSRHGELMYEEIRHRTTDVKNIAKHTPFKESAVEEIKQHMFFKEHKFADGSIKRFDSDFDQAQAWDRLSRGKGTKSDIEMLKHEYVELTQMRLHGYVYETAHDIANSKHNWAKILIEEMNK